MGVAVSVWLALTVVCVAAIGALLGTEFRHESFTESKRASKHPHDRNVYPAE
jgi:hypothetical protein